MAKRKILVVDDDLELQRLLRMMLELSGFEVITASSGVEALTKVRTERPDLILLDVMMPEMDGYETCRRLRRLPESAHIPIVMLSAADQVDDKVKGLRVGADDYITKPVDSRELIARIEAHLRPAAIQVAYMVGVLGCKSGVGTTVLAINLAVGLAQAVGKEVILLDWHLPMGDVGTILNLEISHTLDAVISSIEELDDQLVDQIMVRHSSGVRVLSASWALDTSTLSPDSLEPVLDIISKEADYVIIDAGWASDTTRVLPLEIVDEVLFLVTPELPALRRAAVYLEWEKKRVVFGERLHLVINRAGISGGISVREVEALLQKKARARLPDDPELVLDSINQGVPLVQHAPRSSLTRSIIRLAQEIDAAVEQAGQGQLP